MAPSRPTDSFKENARAVSKHSLHLVAEVERMLLGNRILPRPDEDVGVISAGRRDLAGLIGPLPARGGHPLRRAQGPPVPEVRRGRFRRSDRTNSDSLRIASWCASRSEAERSASSEQCLESSIADEGPVNRRRTARVILPPKSRGLHHDEGTIQHFKNVMGG
jgi:hypothetical protein